MNTGKVRGTYYIENGLPASIGDLKSQVLAGTYYEVVRLVEGRIAFLPDHLDRFRNSLASSGTPYPGDQAVRHCLQLLYRSNDIPSGNIRITLEKTGGEPRLLCYFIPYYYPSTEAYRQGVRLDTFSYVRPDPGIKKWDQEFRSQVQDFIRKKGIYEALLINDQQQITEGSRSNVFFINQEQKVLTSPESSILPGITRKYVLQLCRDEDIPVVEKLLVMEELDNMEACFLSGTSPKVLPVARIGDIRFHAKHPISARLMRGFDRIMNQHMETIA